MGADHYLLSNKFINYGCKKLIELRNLISRWVYEYYYLFLISTISILKNKNIISGNNLVICKGGIGDTIICINIMNTCSNFCSNTVILTKADQIDFIQKFCKHKLLGITSDIDETYCKINSIQNIYSIRSNPIPSLFHPLQF